MRAVQGYRRTVLDDTRDVQDYMRAVPAHARQPRCCCVAEAVYGGDVIQEGRRGASAAGMAGECEQTIWRSRVSEKCIVICNPVKRHRLDVA